VVLVGGTSAGAFVLSYNTPTVGLGCRTGGYLVFFVVAFVLLLAEITVWWLTSPLRDQDHFHVVLENYAQQLAVGRHQLPKHTSLPGLATSKSALLGLLKLLERMVIGIVLLCARLIPGKWKQQKLAATEASIRDYFSTLQNLTTRNWLQRIFFIPLEFFNMFWACCLIFAQTVGAFRNCACMSASWGSLGGYLDFAQINVADSPLVVRYWIQGTAVTCVVMSVGMAYIVLEVSAFWLSSTTIQLLSAFTALFLLSSTRTWVVDYLLD